MAVNITFPKGEMRPAEAERGTIINRLLNAGHGAAMVSGHENALIDNALGFTHLVHHPNEMMTHLINPSHRTGQ